MENRLDRALVLRKEGKLKESNEIFRELANEFPENAMVNYQCAWSCDVLGEEAAAVPYYEKAIQLGLPEEELQGALLGLGSTYRTLGEYEKSKDVLSKGVTLYPGNRALQVFYSMTLYNLKEHQRAMELLLKCLVETTSDEDILHYKRAITFYSDKLDQTWK
ncbi:tetratricopeptide repeat protein [Neobacillus sp. D3-1R]|uniref:tetratricopeptide repeat protein n=1 Tax=Neobacillus sp. D3-1R TaxID=3445778 RepID=UPI003F9F888C